MIVEHLEIWLTRHNPRVAPDRDQGERSAGQGRWLEAARADTVLAGFNSRLEQGF